MKRTKPKPTFPTLADGEPAAMVCVELRVIPLLAGVVRKFEQRDVWATADDHQRAYQWAAAFQEQLMTSCMQQLIDEQRRTYRLLDTALNGTQYQDVAGVITPELPAVPPASTSAPNAMRAHIGRIWQLSENMTAGRTFGAGAGIDGSPALDNNQELRAVLVAMQGMLPGGWPFGFGDRPATVADIVTALRNDSQGQIDRVKNTFDLLQRSAQVATIFGTVANFLEEGAADVAEGGILATMIVSVMAQSAMMGAQAGQLDNLIASVNRLVTSMDGGAETPPATNVISELQAANEALV